MDLANNDSFDDSRLLDTNILQISCNWKITNGKPFRDAFTVMLLPKESIRTNYEEIVSLKTCISLEPIELNNEPCVLDIKLTNGQRISQIAVVSEACVLEFFKQSGEYETTKFAELIEEFDDTLIYFAETAILPHTTEASIKYTKTSSKNSTLWIYGIRLYLSKSNNESTKFSTEVFNPEIVQHFLSKLNVNNKGNNTTNDVQSYHINILNSSKSKNIQENNGKEITQPVNDNTIPNNTDIMLYIDKKFQDMETRLMSRIDEMEQKTNHKLDIILKQLEACQNIK